MEFQEAIRSGFRNYVNFSGRALRSEFWFWILFTIAGGLAAEVLDYALIPGWVTYSPFSGVFEIATFLPGLAVSVRRLHDIDRTGWWLLLGLVPLVGLVVLLVWWCTKGSRGYNRFGADPQPAEFSRHGAGRSLHRAQTDRAD
jgi:uncharacterized membrane protein YhaH (DUF805 family)